MPIYVVEGATLKCSAGSSSSKLVIPVGHGVFLKKKKRANANDHKGGYNIMPFGLCSITDSKCSPSTMKWVVPKSDVLTEKEGAVHNNSFCVCCIGGVVKVIDDGQ